MRLTNVMCIVLILLLSGAIGCSTKQNMVMDNNHMDIPEQLRMAPLQYPFTVIIFEKYQHPVSCLQEAINFLPPHIKQCKVPTYCPSQYETAVSALSKLGFTHIESYELQNEQKQKVGYMLHFQR